jgi:glycosyltransferase involved in cell wall biosynthesis
MIQSGLKETKITICVSTYNRLVFLPRLFNSIASQKYKNYEVIVTDNSSTNDIENYIKENSFGFPITYIKNNPPLSFAHNWTAGMHFSKSEWIKVMHDDDFFSSDDALGIFAQEMDADFDIIFSGYNAYFENNQALTNKTINQEKFNTIKKNPFLLLANNLIGNPSVVMFKNKGIDWYNPAFTWLVDLEAYVRMLKEVKCGYIDQALINISFNDIRVTSDCFRNPEIEIHEWLLFFKTHGRASCNNIVIYDAWWRMIRNLKIRSVIELNKYSKGFDIPLFLEDIVLFQQKIPESLLQIGLCSKFLMSICYLIKKIKRH